MPRKVGASIIRTMFQLYAQLIKGALTISNGDARETHAQQATHHVSELLSVARIIETAYLFVLRETLCVMW